MNAPSSDVSAMAELKRGTADIHDRVEGQINWEESFSSVQNYVRFLRTFESATSKLDIAISRHVPVNERQYAEAPRTSEWIRADLEILDQQGKPQEAQTLPESLQHIESRAAAIGALYVLEGSALGGQIMSRMLRSRLGIEASSGGKYLNGYGHETSDIWRNFRHWVNSELSTAPLIKNAVHSARQTFLWLATQLQMES